MVERSHKKKRATSISIHVNLYSSELNETIINLYTFPLDWLFLVIEILVSEIPRGEIIGSQGGPRDETEIQNEKLALQMVYNIISQIVT